MIIVTPRCGYSLICRPISSFIGYDKELDCRVLFIALVDSKATNIKSYKPVTTFSRSFNTTGFYTGREVKMMFILAGKREAPVSFRLIKNIDTEAFVSQSAVIGVYGEGFDHIKVE